VPGRLAVQAEEGAAAMPALVEVVHAQAIGLVEVMRPETVAGQMLEPLVRRAQGLDHGVLSFLGRRGRPHAAVNASSPWLSGRPCVSGRLSSRSPASGLPGRRRG